MIVFIFYVLITIISLSQFVYIFLRISVKKLVQGRIYGWGEGDDGADAFFPFSSGIRPPADPSYYYFEISLSGDGPQNFLEGAFGANILILRGERAPKNSIFWSKFSKKCLKTPFLASFFSKSGLRRRQFGQNRGKTVLWESSKNQFGRPKKKGRQNFRKFFENPPPPPREKS